MIFNFSARVKGRPRLGRGGRVFTPKQTVEFENAVREMWADRKIDGPCAVEIIIGKEWFSVQVWPMNDIRPPAVRGDLDNFVKSILDGLVGVAFDNDSQVHFVEARFSKKENGDDLYLP